MGRDISNAVPDNIASLIIERWGDHGSFVEACEIKYSGEKVGYNGVYSILSRTGGRRALELLDKLADGFQCDIDQIADVFRLPLGEPRREKLRELAGDRALSNISEKCFGYKSKISDIINGRSGSSHIPNLIAIVDALGIDLKRFRQEYLFAGQAA